MGEVRPRFSVVLPLRDRVDHAGRAAVSVLAQTFSDVELLVVHDGLRGEQVDAVRLVADRRVRILELDPAEAVVEGIAAGRGELVAVIDVATAARPHWLARCGRLLDRSGADLVLCGGSQHHLDGSRSEIQPAPDILRPGAVIGPPSDIAELTRAASRPDPLSKPPHDHPWGRAVRTPEPLLDWFERATSRAPHGDRLRLRWALEAIEVLGDSPIPDVELLSRSATIGGIAAARLGDHSTSRQLFAMARRLRPGELKPFARWAVASIPALSERVWDPERDDRGVPIC
jgi:hypothetical protein